MKAEAQLQYMADFYPNIFPTRKHALNHLFCVIGNGFKWINGELVDEDSEYLKRYTVKEDAITVAEFPNEDNWYSMHDFYVDLYEDTPDKIPWKYQFEWYDLGQYAKIYSVPEDIKPDWKELVEECKRLLEQDGIYLKEDLYNGEKEKL